MKLKHYFVLLTIGVMALTGITFYATYGTHPTLFYFTEAFIVVLFIYLWYFYSINPIQNSKFNFIKFIYIY